MDRVLSEPVGTVTAYLEVTGTGTVKPCVFPVHDEVVIGRDPKEAQLSGNYLCVPEHTVSRRHARIRRRGDRYTVEDLQSFNGTTVSGKRLRSGIPEPLRDGDEVWVSSVQIVFHSMTADVSEREPTIIAKAVDATEFTRVVPSPTAVHGDVQHVVQKLHAMAQVGIALGVVTDRATLIDKIMHFIFDVFPLAERAFILLKENGSPIPVPIAARRRNGMIEDPAQLKLSRTIVEEVLTKKQAILSVDTLADRHFAGHESIIAQAIRSVMCVPLLLEGEVLGLLQVDTSSDPYAFKEDDLEMLSGVCAETAVVLKNFQLYSDIGNLLDGFVRASVQAIEERDPATAGHSFRVADYAERLAIAVDRDSSPALRQVSFSKDQVREVRYAALLHDFGKVGVRENVLRKEKKLHASDMRLLEQRFKYARCCLERNAYRQLAEEHLRHGWGLAEFGEKKRDIDVMLCEECARLDQFLQTIRHANEPAISHTERIAGLDDVVAYRYREAEDIEHPLLEPGEFLALSITRGCLTPEERYQIESHVVDSYSFLVLIPWTRDLAGVPAIAHGHHEKLDGSGYPLGLRGDQISVQTRMLTICDIFDALTAGDRPYKKALPLEHALDLLAEECRIGHLDPRLFNVFVESKAWAAA